MAESDLTARPARLEAADIQALLRTGFGDLREACFLLLTVTDPAAARRWLAAHLRSVTTAERRDEHEITALQIAFTAAGLRALEIPDGVIARFAPEFVAGMAGDPARSRRLGDVGTNDPAQWRWGGAHPPHLLVMLYAAQDIATVLKDVSTADFTAGFATPQMLRTEYMDGKEPFGFTDGISQPVLDWDNRRTPGTSADLDYGNLLSAGEFLLGHGNEYGLYTDRPLLDPAAPGAGVLARAEDDSTRADLGRNGSYLVLRELHQNVAGFWQFMTDHADDQAIALAETMVGRRMDGAPLVPIQDAPIPGVEGRHSMRNRFTFDEDRDGLHCPIGAHIRRANPRTGDMPPGGRGLLTRLIRMLGFGSPDLREDLIAATRFHRLLRRGRPFGDPTRSDAPIGLYFIGLNANIARQFEFIQNAWMVNAKFAGLNGEADPLLGNPSAFPPGEVTNSFGIPQPNGACRTLTGLPQFVTVRGGEYFFLPSIRALRYIARIA